MVWVSTVLLAGRRRVVSSVVVVVVLVGWRCSGSLTTVQLERLRILAATRAKRMYFCISIEGRVWGYFVVVVVVLTVLASTTPGMAVLATIFVAMKVLPDLTKFRVTAAPTRTILLEMGMPVSST